MVAEIQDKIHPLTHDLLRLRWSPRAFDTRPIEQDKLHSLFEAARWAPSAANQQPWRFIATEHGQESYQRLFDTLAPGNQRWAGKAPVLILVVAKLYENPGAEHVALYDTGQAVANLSVQATAQGLHVHQMGGFDAEKAREAFAIPEGYVPVTVVAVGYLGDAAALPEDLRAREQAPRTRKPLDELVFQNTWNMPARCA